MDYKKERPTGEIEAAGQPTDQELRENAMNCLEKVSYFLKNTEKRLCRQTNEEIERSMLEKVLHCELLNLKRKLEEEQALRVMEKQRFTTKRMQCLSLQNDLARVLLAKMKKFNDNKTLTDQMEEKHANRVETESLDFQTSTEHSTTEQLQPSPCDVNSTTLQEKETPSEQECRKDGGCYFKKQVACLEKEISTLKEKLALIEDLLIREEEKINANVTEEANQGKFRMDVHEAECQSSTKMETTDLESEETNQVYETIWSTMRGEKAGMVAEVNCAPENLSAWIKDIEVDNVRLKLENEIDSLQTDVDTLQEMMVQFDRKATKRKKKSLLKIFLCFW